MAEGTVEIRKLITVMEETLVEGGVKVAKPVRKAVALAVVTNPYAGKYSENLSLLVDYGEELGKLLVNRALGALGGGVEDVESFGKGAIVAWDGELEHAAAILHPKLGANLRVQLDGKAIVPSTKKRGGVGVPLDVPLGYKKAAFVRSHFDAIEVRVPDAPGAGEIVVAVALSNSGRPHPRVGGLRKEEAKGEDGLR